MMQIAKWGNSLAVRLPKHLVERLGLREGDDVEVIGADERSLVLAKADRRAAALARMQSRHWTLPAGYTFDREEANTREANAR
jgi:antitoxin MazE